MAQDSRYNLKQHFQTGDIPSQGNYADLIDSKLSIKDHNSGSIILSGSIDLASAGANTNHTSSITVEGMISSSHVGNSGIIKDGIKYYGSIHGNQFHIGDANEYILDVDPPLQFPTISIGTINSKESITFGKVASTDSHNNVTIQAPEGIQLYSINKEIRLVGHVTHSVGNTAFNFSGSNKITTNDLFVQGTSFFNRDENQFTSFGGGVVTGQDTVSVFATNGISGSGFVYGETGSFEFYRGRTSTTDDNRSGFTQPIKNWEGDLLLFSSSKGYGGGMVSASLISSSTMLVDYAVTDQLSAKSLTVENMFEVQTSQGNIYLPRLKLSTNRGVVYNKNYSQLASSHGIAFVLGGQNWTSSGAFTSSFEIWQSDGTLGPGDLWTGGSYGKTFKIFEVGHSGSIDICKNITASGHISSSGTIVASNFSGTTSGTNTGDQSLVHLAVTSSNVLFSNITASNNIDITGDISGSTASTASFGSLKIDGSSVDFSGLPTADTGLPVGRLYNDSGVIKIKI